VSYQLFLYFWFYPLRLHWSWFERRQLLLSLPLSLSRTALEFRCEFVSPLLLSLSSLSLSLFVSLIERKCRSARRLSSVFLSLPSLLWLKIPTGSSTGMLHTEIFIHSVFANRFFSLHILLFSCVVLEDLIHITRIQGILINGQFPGPDIHSVTNDNLIINVFNSLDQPFLLSWYTLP